MGLRRSEPSSSIAKPPTVPAGRRATSSAAGEIVAAQSRGEPRWSTGSELKEKLEKKAERAGRRDKAHRSTIEQDRLTNTSFLVKNVVQPKTLEDYKKRLAAFREFAGTVTVTPLESMLGPELGKLVVEYFEFLFLDGAAAGEAEKVLSAIELLMPNARRGEENEPAGARLALRGFRRLSPTATRAPLPYVALCCMIGTALHLGHVEFAIAILTGFTAYLRPGELLSLTGAQLVEPLKGSGVKWWSLLLAPEEKGVPSKIGVFDETALLDTEVMLRIAPQLRRLKKKAGEQRLWSFSGQEFNDLFRTISEAASVQVLKAHPYALRHGGASHDSLHRLRTPEQIKKQGRWKSDSSVARYNKHARVVTEANKLSGAAQSYGEQVRKKLVEFILRPHLAPAPPRSGGLCVAGREQKRRRKDEFLDGRGMDVKAEFPALGDRKAEMDRKTDEMGRLIEQPSGGRVMMARAAVATAKEILRRQEGDKKVKAFAGKVRPWGSVARQLYEHAEKLHGREISEIQRELYPDLTFAEIERRAANLVPVTKLERDHLDRRWPNYVQQAGTRAIEAERLQRSYDENISAQAAYSRFMVARQAETRRRQAEDAGRPGVHPALRDVEP